MDSPVFYSGQGQEIFLFSQMSGPVLWPGYRRRERGGEVPFPGVKRLCHEGDHSPQFRLWMSGTISVQLPPPPAHEMDMDKYTIVENCQHLEAELKVYDQSFHFRVKNFALHTFPLKLFLSPVERRKLFCM